MKQEIPAGVLSLSSADGLLRFSSEHYGDWVLPISEIKLIAEYTTEDGPFCEEHYIVFAKSIQHIYEAPFAAKGAEKILDHLGDVLQVALEPELVLETFFNSRILYPTKYRGLPFLEYTDDKESKGSLTGRIFSLLKPWETISRRPSSIACRILDSTESRDFKK